MTRKFLNWSRNFSQAGRGGFFGEAIRAVSGQARSGIVRRQATCRIGVQFLSDLRGRQCVPWARLG